MSSVSLSRGQRLDVGGIGIDQDRLPGLDHGPIELKRWFDPEQIDSPLELEIGAGKGTFLVQTASETPHINYIGIEYARAYWRYAADRCRRRGLENVRLVHIEAGAFVRNYVPAGCLNQVHIYFPDPWPKTRHHKRRLIQEGFLRDLDRTLVPSGQIRLATDHADYYQWMLDHAARVGDLFEQIPFETPTSGGDDELVGTNFERKYRREGRAFCALMLRKRSRITTKPSGEPRDSCGSD